jgi:hypothetical protein
VTITEVQSPKFTTAYGGGPSNGKPAKAAGRASATEPDRRDDSEDAR